MYDVTKWQDHVTDPANTFYIVKNDDGTYTITPAGTVMQQGTPQDQTHFQNMESGIHDAQIAARLLANAIRQHGWHLEELDKWIKDHDNVEVGEVTLTNSLKFPFNNSKKTIPLQIERETTHYIVVAEIVSFVGNVGEIEATEKLTNGFKLGFTGGASKVVVKYFVLGGYEA
ncbi:MAG: hypothetical protein J6B49_00810 [Phascolarctobacterium sp.]|nr:hypothetical protein [Phascolarctobacterium sp.]